VMVLAPGVNKASGLAAALEDLRLSPHNVVGVGDAENDHAFLRACGCSVAVANALPTLKQEADIVTQAERGAGVAEIVEHLLSDDFASVDAVAARHRVLVGADAEGRQVFVGPHSGSVLISGTSGGGKSTLATAILERLVEHRFQFCVLDPEGDYAELENAVVLGDAKAAPRLPEILDLLDQPHENVVVNLLSLEVADRPAFFAKLLPELANLRARTGRPHWILVDEAHHMLPAARGGLTLTLPQELPAAIFVTVHPDAMSPDALATVGTVLAIGDAAADVVATFCGAIGEPVPALPDERPRKEQALVWSRHAGLPARLVEVEGPRQARRRHTRKYALGNLGEDKSFYFRGPEDVLNLRAQNLTIFLQLADGVDDGTWMHHLRSGDYSKWFRTAIRDDDLADEAAAVEQDEELDAAESRARIKEAVERRYTAPASEEE
jgi:haloacid dehalogenase-like hydrolase/Helicase HerA, central domain